MFIGNKNQVVFFERAVQNGQLSHAYCFCGPEGIGKTTLAKMVAAQILAVKENNLFQSPNFYYYEREIDEKTGKQKKEITISQAREIKEKMTKKAWGNRGQVLIVEGAQYLNEESGNAILKALEEPAQDSFLFLLSDHEKNILPTVLSRCQKIVFNPVGLGEITQGLVELGFDLKTAELSALFSKGIPGKAVRLAEDNGFREDVKAEVRRWLTLFKMDFYKKIESLEGVLSEKDGNKARDVLIKKMDFWLELWRELLLFKTKKQAGNLLTEAEMTSLNRTPEQIKDNIDNIVKTQNNLKNNVQTRLAVEQLLLKF